MVKKFINYLGVFVFVLATLGVLWLILEPIIYWTDKSEMRIYCRLFLIMMAIITFAILRLYNAIVQNTRFEIKLRDSINKVSQYFPTLERALHSVNQSLGMHKNSIEALRKAEDQNRDAIEKLIENAKKLSNATTQK